MNRTALVTLLILMLLACACTIYLWTIPLTPSEIRLHQDARDITYGIEKPDMLIQTRGPGAYVAAALQAPAGITINWEIQGWHVLVALLGIATVWGVAMYRISSHGKQLELVFDHEKNQAIHQTPEERRLIAEAIAERFKEVHNVMAELRQNQMEVQRDIKEILRSVKQ